MINQTVWCVYDRGADDRSLIRGGEMIGDFICPCASLDDARFWILNRYRTSSLIKEIHIKSIGWHILVIEYSATYDSGLHTFAIMELRVYRQPEKMPEAL